MEWISVPGLLALSHDDLCSRGAVPLHLFKSPRSFAKADRSGLSCMLWPFLPLSPHLLASPTSSVVLTVRVSPEGFLLSREFRPIVELLGASSRGVEMAPPRIAETEDCAHRACLRIAEVTVIHSVTTSATGSMATEIGWRVGAKCAVAPVSPSMLDVSSSLC